MQTKLTSLFTVIFLLTVCAANATIWRVNNNGFTANFTTLQDANDDNNVSDGDTIHLEGSTINYAGASISKRLIIVGAGYFLNENPSTSNDFLTANLLNISFDIGSAGSQIIGVYIGNNPFGITVNVSDIIIKRCRIDANIHLSYQIADIKILSNFFSGSSASSLIQTSPFGFPTNVVFNNNICQKTLILRDGQAYTLLECKNNIFDCPAISGNPSIKMNVSAFENNILRTSNATVDINNKTNSNVAYNIGSSANNQFGASNNNIVVANMAALFVDAATNSPDGEYQLKPNSAGSGNGSDGTDRGAYGGSAVTNRYTLSGLAPIPVIYKVMTPGVATPSGLQITIKARTIK